ncbi:MAG: hypothetical protein ABWX70_10530 [Hyphomicrobium sp.]
MHSTNAAPCRITHFASAKTATAIPVHDDQLQEALVQASLDPRVRSIGYIATATVDSRTVRVDAVVFDTDDGRHHLDLLPVRRERSAADARLAELALAELGLRPLTVTYEELHRQPRRANVRTVWSCRNHRVAIGLRMRIQQALIDDGPMQLGRLLAGIRSDFDPTPAVMALACADLIELDLLSRPLGPATVVGARS